MSMTFKTVVFRAIEPHFLVMCEYNATMHTLIEVRYQIDAFDATEQLAPDPVYRKGEKIAESSWKQTPKEARDEIADELGIELKKENIVHEETFTITIPIIDEDS